MGKNSSTGCSPTKDTQGLYIWGRPDEGGVPQIIGKELFYSVQDKLTKKNPKGGWRRANGDYQLWEAVLRKVQSPMTGMSER